MYWDFRARLRSPKKIACSRRWLSRHEPTHHGRRRLRRTPPCRTISPSCSFVARLGSRRQGTSLTPRAAVFSALPIETVCQFASGALEFATPAVGPRPYQVRARLADLAGDGLTLDDANALGTRFALPGPDQHFPFQRFEVISSPIPVFRAGRQAGETNERIVLRSNRDTSPETFATQQPRYRNANERHIAPPKASQLMVEMFGLFDASIGSGNDLDRTYNLALRDKGSLNDRFPIGVERRDLDLRPPPS